jgi:hypothetical protein
MPCEELSLQAGDQLQFRIELMFYTVVRVSCGHASLLGARQLL